MRALSAADLLTVWERGRSESPAQRALALLTLACAETPVERLAQLSIGQRDAQLLALRERTFGPQLASIATCPACETRLEFRIDAEDIRATTVKEENERLSLTYQEYDVQFRLPNGLDLTTLDPSSDGNTNLLQLLQRCVNTAQRTGKEIRIAELPAAVVAAIAQRMAEADPQADVQIALACPQCHHAWQTPLDIVSYFWTEIQAWASRILREVHVLAAAYGWREVDVLALSPYRRQAYLEMIGP